MAEYKIYARNPDLTRAGEVDEYGTLDVTLRFNSPHVWTLDVPGDSPMIEYLLQPGAGIIVTRDDNVILSGPIIDPVRDWDKTTNVLNLTGSSDLIHISDRLAYPTPSGPPYSTAYDVRTGAAETVMREYVLYNAGSSANLDRQVNGLILAPDLARGGTVTGRARFDRLIELLQSLAASGGGLGFDLVQSGNNLVFQVYQPADKSSILQFSPDVGNLLAYSYSITQPGTNYIICGGQGEEAARVFKERGNWSSISTFKRRIETFKDFRSAQSDDELYQSIDEELANNAVQTSLSITPVDVPNMRFGTDYNLGDMVSVVIDGQKIVDVLKEIRITVSKQTGEEIIPTLGTPSLDILTKTFSTLRSLATRLGRLERR